MHRKPTIWEDQTFHQSTFLHQKQTMNFYHIKPNKIADELDKALRRLNIASNSFNFTQAVRHYILRVLNVSRIRDIDLDHHDHQVAQAHELAEGFFHLYADDHWPHRGYGEHEETRQALTWYVWILFHTDRDQGTARASAATSTEPAAPGEEGGEEELSGAVLKLHIDNEQHASERDSDKRGGNEDPNRGEIFNKMIHAELLRDAFKALALELNNDLDQETFERLLINHILRDFTVDRLEDLGGLIYNEESRLSIAEFIAGSFMTEHAGWYWPDRRTDGDAAVTEALAGYLVAVFRSAGLGVTEGSLGEDNQDEAAEASGNPAGPEDLSGGLDLAYEIEDAASDDQQHGSENQDGQESQGEESWGDSEKGEAMQSERGEIECPFSIYIVVFGGENEMVMETPCPATFATWAALRDHIERVHP